MMASLGNGLYMQSDQYVRDGGREDSKILNPPFGLFIKVREGRRAAKLYSFLDYTAIPEHIKIYYTSNES